MLLHLRHLKAALGYIFSSQARFLGKYDERDLLLGHGIDNLTSIRVVVALSLAVALVLMMSFYYTAHSLNALLFILVMEALCLYTVHLPRAGMGQAVHSNFSKLNMQRSYRSYLQGRILFTPYGISLSLKKRTSQSIQQARFKHAQALIQSSPSANCSPAASGITSSQERSSNSSLKLLYGRYRAWVENFRVINGAITLGRAPELSYVQISQGLSKAQQEHQARLYLANHGNKSAAMILHSGVNVDDYIIDQGILAATQDSNDLPIANSGYITQVAVPLLCDQRIYAGKYMTMEAIAQILCAKAAQESSAQKRSFMPTDLCLLGFGFEWLPKHSRALRQIMAVGTKAAPLGGDGSPDIHAVEVDHAYEPIVTSTNKLKGHTLLLGTTGSGKTRFFDLLVSQAIMRGDTVIVLDPKGDRDLQRSIIKAARAAEREPYQNLVCLDIGRPVSNPLNSSSAIEYAAASTGVLKQFAMDSRMLNGPLTVAPLSPFELSRNNLTTHGHLSLINEDFYERQGANSHGQIEATPIYQQAIFPANSNSTCAGAMGDAHDTPLGTDVMAGTARASFSSDMATSQNHQDGAYGAGRVSFKYNHEHYIREHNVTDASLRAQRMRYDDPNLWGVTDADPDERLFDEINFGLNPTSIFDRASEVASRLTSMVDGGGSAANFKAYAAMAITAAVECCRLTGEKVTLDAIRSYIASHQKFTLAIRDIMNQTVVNLNNVYCSRYYNRIYGISDAKLVRNAYTISVLMANGYKYISLTERAKVMAVLEDSGLLEISDNMVEDADKLQQIESLLNNHSLTQEIRQSTATKSRSRKSSSTDTSKSEDKEKKPRYLAAPAPLKALYEFYIWLTKSGYLDRDNAIEQIFEVSFMDPVFFQKVTNSIMPSLVSLTSGVLKQLLSSDDCKQTSFMEIVRNNKIFYAALHCLKDSITGQNLGKLLMADLAYVAGEINAKNIQGHSQVTVFIDEASELANEVLVQLLNKSRASNFAVTIATQSVADLRARVHSKDAADQIIANCNNLLSLRVEDEDTANVIAKVLPNTVCTHESTSLSVSAQGLTGTSTASRTLSQQDCEYFPATMLMQLPNFEFIARLANGSCYKGFIPIIDKLHSGYQRPSFAKVDQAQDYAYKQNLRLRHNSYAPTNERSVPKVNPQQRSSDLPLNQNNDKDLPKSNQAPSTAWHETDSRNKNFQNYDRLDKNHKRTLALDSKRAMIDGASPKSKAHYAYQLASSLTNDTLSTHHTTPLSRFRAYAQERRSQENLTKLQATATQLQAQQHAYDLPNTLTSEPIPNPKANTQLAIAPNIASTLKPQSHNQHHGNKIKMPCPESEKEKECARAMDLLLEVKQPHAAARQHLQDGKLESRHNSTSQEREALLYKLMGTNTTKPNFFSLEGPHVNAHGFAVGHSHATLEQENKVYVGNEHNMLYTHFDDQAYQQRNQDHLSCSPQGILDKGLTLPSGHNQSPAPILVNALESSQAKMNREYLASQKAKHHTSTNTVSGLGTSSISLGQACKSLFTRRHHLHKSACPKMPSSAELIACYGWSAVLALVLRYGTYPVMVVLKWLLKALFNQSWLRLLSIGKELSFLILLVLLLLALVQPDKLTVLKDSALELVTMGLSYLKVLTYGLMHSFTEINELLYQDSSVGDRMVQCYQVLINNYEIALTISAISLLWGNHYGLMAEMQHRSLLALRCLLRPFSWFNHALTLSALAMLYCGIFPCVEYALCVVWLKLGILAFNLTCFYSMHTK